MNVGVLLLNISTADWPIPVAPPVRTTTLSLSVASKSALNSILDILDEQAEQGVSMKKTSDFQGFIRSIEILEHDFMGRRNVYHI